MGTACTTCLKGDTTTTVIQPEMAARRQMQMEAAERRRIESEKYGIKDPDKVKRMQQRAAILEANELEATKQGAFANPTLKWQAD